MRALLWTVKMTIHKAAIGAVAGKVLAPGAASAIALLALIEPPPFGNIWFDMLAGAVFLFLCQCFAYSLERPHAGSSDFYKSFHRFCSAVFGVAAMGTRVMPGNAGVRDFKG